MSEGHKIERMTPELTIALAKGRMMTGALTLLRRTGIEIEESALASRRLSIEDKSNRYRFIFVKPADVGTYVEHGTADCGVTGRDVLLESESDVLQPLDLRIAQCRISVAAPVALLRGTNATLEASGMLRVATKYPRIAMNHFSARGVPVEIIELAGSVELAPVLGLADCIVDLVETGRTLEENGLTIVEDITTSSARFIVNRASYQLKTKAIARLIEELSCAVAAGVTN